MRAPDFWQSDSLVARLLDPFGRLYGLAGDLRRRFATTKTVSVPVICIGNLTVGGAGKTPTSIAIAKHLRKSGHAPHLLTRGYGGRNRGPHLVDIDRDEAVEVGDEALLLARIAPCWVSRDRVVGAEAAMKAGASVIILDDGHQNPHLAYDLAVIVVDARVGFGNNRMMPAGPLRETVIGGLARADALVRIGANPGQEPIESHLPVFDASIQPTTDNHDLQGRRLVAFAGIGRPEKFFETLQDLGAVLVETRSFPDHHRYTTPEVEEILTHAGQVDASCITTEKDHVRLPLPLGNSVKKLPIELRFEAKNALDLLISMALSSERGR